MLNENGFQGTFISTGTTFVVQFPTDIQWMEVINLSLAVAGAGAGTGVRWWWQLGMQDGYGIVSKKLAADQSITYDYQADCFSLVNTYTPTLSAINNTLTQVSGANPPVVSATSTAGLADYDTVKLVNVPGAEQFNGVDFTIDTLVANTSFRLPFAPQIVTTGAVAGSFYKVKNDDPFYPRRRYISAITQANPGVITTTAYHGYTVGQKIRLHVPAEYGMIQADGLDATITAINAANATITTNIDTSGFTAFAWPLTAVAAAGVTPAHITPIGEDATYNTLLTDRVYNTGARIMLLAPGVDGPAGTFGNEMMWRAGRSLMLDNQWYL